MRTKNRENLLDIVEMKTAYVNINMVKEEEVGFSFSYKISDTNDNLV